MVSISPSKEAASISALRILRISFRIIV